MFSHTLHISEVAPGSGKAMSGTSGFRGPVPTGVALSCPGDCPHLTICGALRAIHSVMAAAERRSNWPQFSLQRGASCRCGVAKWRQGATVLTARISLGAWCVHTQEYWLAGEKNWSEFGYLFLGHNNYKQGIHIFFSSLQMTL